MERKEVQFAEKLAKKIEREKKEKAKVDDFMERVKKPYPNCTICRDKLNKMTEYLVIEKKDQHAC